MAIIAGYLGFVEIADRNNILRSFHATRWSVDWRVDAIDTSSFMNFGWATYDPGVVDYDISIDFIYDPVDNPGGRPILTPGTSVRAVLWTVEGLAVERFFFPRMIIGDVRLDDSIRDVLRFSITGKANHMNFASSVVFIRQPGRP
jgi:hypothetical protein